MCSFHVVGVKADTPVTVRGQGTLHFEGNAMFAMKLPFDDKLIALARNRHFLDRRIGRIEHILIHHCRE